MEFNIEGLRPVEVIGQGGFGVVHRATDEVHGRQVAVKTLTGLLDESARRRFDRERKAMGKLSGHPNIGVVHTSGFSEDGNPYIVMEYLAGGSLQDRLDGGRFDVAEVIDIGVALSGALERAHEMGVLHLDLKPANVLYSEFELPKLVDFGIAAIVGDDPKTTAIRATPAYGAPEVLDGKPATASSDTYGLAATLYALLMGDGPYSRPGGSALQLIRSVAIDPVPRVDRNDVPEWLVDLLHRAMAKDPEDRPPTMASFGAELARLDDGVSGASAVGEQLPAQSSAMLAPASPAGGPREISGPLPVASASTQQRGQRAGVALLGFAALALVVALAVVVGRGGDESPDAPGLPANDPTPTPAPTEEPTATPGAIVQPTAVVAPTPTLAPPTPTPDLRVTVPDVVGVELDAAVSTLQTAGFQVRFPDHCFSFVDGSVPSPGAFVAPGATIDLTFAPCVVPDFVGLRLPEAIALSEGLGALGIEWAAHCDNLVIGQSIAPLTIVAPLSTTVFLDLPSVC